MTDLISGQVQIMAGPMIAAMPHVKSGRVRALAVMSQKRVPGMPDLPTAGETVKGYETSIWHGVLMPKGVPQAILRQVNREINELLKLPEVRERMAGQGAETVGGSPEEFAAWIKADTEKYSKLLKQIGLAGTEK
jgi:tripartite-type tricarboxylate transporter receptor subunit TctC